MKYIVGAFWALVFGEILGYIGSSLDGSTYSVSFIGIWAIVLGLAGTFLFSKISFSAAPDEK
ncbi:DUF2929 family protein [Periweissella cryptocerci]|uniref:DUF2929 family protein n=1 Tax=Periweissella cryptocerci TaxID=2506420 RepID=A0A4P6YW33_9LACO|nr:YjzD family protein [Periweissella cryptocerci]QBO37010.1 DUF2929 family protein [Periweissella cryptocerci]